MKKSLFIIILILACSVLPSFATEAPTGNKIEKSQLQFLISGTYQGNVKIKLSDIASSTTYNFDFIKSSKDFKSDPIELVANTTYTASYLTKDNEPIYFNGSELKAIAITPDIKIINLSVGPSDISISGNQQLIQAKANKIIKILEKSDVSNVKGFMDIWTGSSFESLQKEIGDSQVDYIKLKQSDQFFYDILYLYPKQFLLSGQYSSAQYLNQLDIILNQTQLNNVKELHKNIKEIWEIQWNNYNDNNTIFNPLNDKKIESSIRAMDEKISNRNEDTKLSETYSFKNVVVSYFSDHLISFIVTLLVVGYTINVELKKRKNK